MVPKVDTFEGDISDEIRRKEASLTEISAASNDVGNNDDKEVVLPKRTPVFLVLVAVFFVIFIIGAATLLYLHFANTSSREPLPPQGGTSAQVKAPEMKNVSSVLASEIGRFVTRLEKKDVGYVISINNYPAVFAYMTRNEEEYIEELSTLFPQAQESKAAPAVASTTQVTVPASSTSTASSTPSTKKATTTPQVATTSPTTTSPVVEEIKTSPFSDVTISNQNMRVWKEGGRTVVYAFVGDTTVLISNSAEGILLLKSAILR